MKTIFSAVALAMLALTAGQAQAGSGRVQKSVDTVRPQSADSYTIGFFSGETAAVYLKGYGLNPLWLEIYNPSGVLIFQGSDASGDTGASFVPLVNGVYTIKVRNLYGESQTYVLATN